VPRRLPQSLRWRLALRVAAVLVVAFGVTYVAVYRGTGAQLRGQIDRELGADGAAFSRSVAPVGDREDAAELRAAAARYVSTQPFGATSRLLFAEVPGQPTQSNQPELLGLNGITTDEDAEAQHAENRLSTALLAAPDGFSTVRAPDVGWLRLLVVPVRASGVTVARLAVGEPLAPVERAQNGVQHTFLIAGGLTLAVALLVAYALAARFVEPLRRMAAIAARVDAGDLRPRITAGGRADEVRILADAFDHMLDRLENAFARQRSFLSDASHELRTPLTGLRGQLEVLARQADPPLEEVRRVERMALGEIDRMSRLVDDLLFLARTDESRFLAREPIELEPFVLELFELVAATAERRFVLEPIVPGVLDADPARLAQALRNVLVNAVQHTGDGGLVQLAVEPTAAGGVRFVVEDDGPGIPADQRDLVFERFHRTDASRARATGGFGLGLAIVQEIVVAHGGRVTAGEAPSGGGARLELELPGFTPSPAQPIKPGPSGTAMVP
jgi:two-component system OmpR family sensor kinase